MAKPIFHIFSGKKRSPVPSAEFALQADNWDDYGHRTLYQLYYYGKGDDGNKEETFIGNVKILRKAESLEPSRISDPFEMLPIDYCSVGGSLDYYERLNVLGHEIRRRVLSALRDVVQTPTIFDEFKEEPGLSESLFRDQSDGGRAYRQLAHSLITGNYTSLPKEGFAFSFAMPGWEGDTKFDFKADDGDDTFFANPLPDRICVLVGRNGSGKSTLLARLARVAFGTADERLQEPLQSLGEIEPSAIGFPRIVVITFSPFDSFKLPGSDARNRNQLVRDIERNVGRFVFIGLRDIAAEFESPLDESEALLSDDAEKLQDRQSSSNLKSIDKLAVEFERNVAAVKSNNRLRKLKEYWKYLFGSSSLDENDLAPATAAAAFLPLSTGQKIVALIASGLLAKIQPMSLVLFDEPETHLHPPLLAALMHVLRQILSTHEAFGIVATHSPVVVQETMAKHVKVVRREGSNVCIGGVPIETFGENIGAITAEVFRLQSEATDFHATLDHLVRNSKGIDQIESYFLDGHMSDQGRAYVMSRLAASFKE